MIQVEHLTRRYGAFTAVNDVSFQIGRGEVVGLLGHNGAGKSTIMKMLTGFLEPTAGNIYIDKLQVGKDTRAIQARIGYLPENCPVWPDMTVIDYLEYQASLHGVEPVLITRRVAEVIRRCALKQKAVASIQTLSRGYRQRVGVAQALLHHPDIIILDEPTNGLDPTQILQMRQLIKELAKTATVIVSTHILQEVQAVCERVLIMRNGHLVIDSRIEELQTAHGLQLAVNQDASQTIRAIEGVSAITPQAANDGLWHCHIDAAPTLAPMIASAVCNAGLQLYALEIQKRDLESVFADVNREVIHG
ncbi:ABC transporter ATP-binding protein [Shewanella yunxiaonensis]|uniref:ABC transporter ATP-binding protein n=1 Tax=Shewanella yunxiaonensis TaxID=2829809 RepID=A0ABX7YV88_9GAMM|nr:MULTISPECIES: ABC transporter ATP-binding protein [Shewanella]MDF0532856.1 ABC transporter ATP-binding protein [Shewanella sp. A32]QUN06737.1 ABC transporter ATP-binding protein [Shewanella yunxiaonensis]